MESSSTQVQVTSDMLFEILSRSSFKTLATCRLLSKDCNRLTYESSFLNLHSQRTNNLLGFFLQTMRGSKTPASFFSYENPNFHISLDFLLSPSPSVMIKASSLQGILVCIEDKMIPRYYVCKPTTKEWERIPNPKTKYFTESIAIKVLKSKPLHYKIVRLSQPKLRFFGKYNCLRCEIFDSMVSNRRQIEQVKLSCDDQIYSWIPAISVCGKFHWMTIKKNILAFDVDDEKYDLFLFPFTNRYDNVRLTDYEGKLGVIGKADGFFDLWVMEIYKKKEWRKRMRVSVEKEEMHTCYPIGFCNADVALVAGYYNLFWLKFKNGNEIQKVRLDNRFMHQGVFPFRSDFELCDLKNEVRRNKAKPREECMNYVHIYSSVSCTLVVMLVLLFYGLFCFRLIDSIFS
ncbi:F-box protein At5g49610-like [Euphorbia lathyris]|uniref:F-box protein At5g49610-like n=1 Tax=Euphorbia lathyris TaxID=212925 RepID=UPI0033133BF4